MTPVGSVVGSAGSVVGSAGRHHTLAVLYVQCPVIRHSITNTTLVLVLVLVLVRG
tara:strand:+ start:732 stop:896 length:165 start_codon:yes stop_codon:yes gene_type:complete